MCVRIFVFICVYLCVCVFMDLDGEAWLGSFAAIITVNAVAKGPDAGRKGGEGQVVVIPLAEEGD